VNSSKTDSSLLYKNDLTPVTLYVNGVNTTTKKSINIIGAIFDSKLNWT
jgi:hypothetical protein